MRKKRSWSPYFLIVVWLGLSFVGLGGILVLLAKGADFSWQASWGPVFRINESAVVSFASENYLEAQSFLSQALAQSSEEPRLHLNFALVLQKQDQKEQALKSLDVAQELAKSPQDKALIAFVRGTIFQKSGERDNALSEYKKVLRWDPHHLMTKKNIELLWQESKDSESSGDGKSGEQKPKDPKKGDSPSSPEEKKDPPESKPKDSDQEKDPSRGYQNSPKPQPRPFRSQEMDAGQMNQILGEIRNQENRIRADFQRRSRKEEPRGKDW